MITSELPIYRDTFEYVSLLVDYVGIMPKSHRHTLGQKLLNVSLELFEYVQLANRAAGDKFYLQHYSKGCKFLGSVTKMGRMYVGSYTTGRMENRVRWLNTKDPMDADCRDKFRQSINSYMGFLKHYSSYAIRRRMGNIISKDWWSVIYVSGRFLKINIRKKYKSSFSLRGIEVQV